jgi:hypothetical protein
MKSKTRSSKRPLSVVVFSGILTFFFVWKGGPIHEISVEGFERIQIGMSELDVESTLGLPYGQYSTGTIQGTYPGGLMNSPCTFYGRLDGGVLNTTIRCGTSVVHRKGWVANEIAIWLWFDENGTVIDKKAYSVERMLMYDFILHWLGSLLVIGIIVATWCLATRQFSAPTPAC